MEEKTLRSGNPLATEKVGKLIIKFAIPAIISGLVSALYNIVDQIFIGQSIGILGNAATNVAFPLVTISTAIALLIGVGSSSNFSLKLGRNEKEEAGYIAGNGIALLVICGIVLSALILIFLKPLLLAFGATEKVLPYSLTYTGITAFGIPFLIFGTGGSNIVRADTSPKYAMISIMSGAVLNTILDPIFIFGFQMGMAGAAIATVIGQVVSALLILKYFTKFKTVPLTRKHFRPRIKYARAITSLGAAACFNQFAMTAVQIAMNNTLTRYGALSTYGSDIPLACVGVISKVNIIFMALILGVSQGCQPIIGFNYGAKNYSRVKEIYKKGVITVTIISSVAFLCFQFLPRQIISIFGNGSDLYFQFAQRYFRIFMMLTFINGIQPITANFFTSIGKAKLGIAMSLTRQILFLLPLILFLPTVFGIDGVMYAGPIADGVAAVLAIFFVSREMRKMSVAQVSGA